MAPVDLAMEPGRVVALIGPSGLGKTTLLRAAAGLIDPLAGSARLKGETASETGWPQWRRHVVLVTQQPARLDGPAEENLARPFAYRASNGVSFDREMAIDRLNALGLDAEAESDACEPFRFDPGSVFLLLSDGYYEATDAAGAMIGPSRIGAIAREAIAEPAQTILQAVGHGIDEFTSGSPQSDDRTAIVIKRVSA